MENWFIHIYLSRFLVYGMIIFGLVLLLKRASVSGSFNLEETIVIHTAWDCNAEIMQMERDTHTTFAAQGSQKSCSYSLRC